MTHDEMNAAQNEQIKTLFKMMDECRDYKETLGEMKLSNALVKQSLDYVQESHKKQAEKYDAMILEQNQLNSEMLTAMREISTSIHTLSRDQTAMQKDIEGLKTKVNHNEDLQTIDLRKIKKKALEDSIFKALALFGSGAWIFNVLMRWMGK